MPASHDSLPPLSSPPSAPEVLVLMERMNRAAVHVSMELAIRTIHRFPQSLREMAGAEQYVVPSVVAIGPYHHGRPLLQEMEEVKRMVALQFCNSFGLSVREAYMKILSIVGDARSCYSTDDASVARLGDAELAAMMFTDGRFLLNFVVLGGRWQPLAGLGKSCWPTIAKDVLLLENQIPWLVLEALTEVCNNPHVDLVYVNRWIGVVLDVYFLDKKKKKNPCWSRWFIRPLQVLLTKCRRAAPAAAAGGSDDDGDSANNVGSDSDDPKPPHLLGLLRLQMTRGMPPDKRRGNATMNTLLRLSSSAVYLSQIGLKLTPSTVRWFAEVDVQRQPLLFGKLSLSPLFLNDIVARILVNVVALEVAQATSSNAPHGADGFVVSSYLSVLAMFMDREEDVQQLRERGALSAHFSNAQTLAFFKGLAQNLRLGFNYFAVMHGIDDYIQQRPVRIAVHRFVYTNFKIIVSVLPVLSVLVGIFKALYSAKQP